MYVLFFIILKDTNAKNVQDKLENIKASDLPKVPKDDSGMNFVLFWTFCLLFGLILHQFWCTLKQ